MMKWNENFVNNPPHNKPKQRARNLLVTAMMLSLCAPPGLAIFQNGNFENEDFTHWQPSHGVNNGLVGSEPFTSESVKISSGGSSILTLVSNSFDPRAPHLTLPREGNFTAKLNDEKGGAHINVISQRDIITEDDRDPSDGKLHVRFTYAAVLDDPKHLAREQPYFHVHLKDITTGKILFDDIAYSNQPGRLFFTTSYNGTWRSTPFIDVDMIVPDELLGHELEVRALAADCSLSGHGGYVYVDAFSAHKISPQQSCLNNVKARAKPGQVQITWGDNHSPAYRIYRADAFTGPYVALGETQSTYSTWLDKTVIDGQEYFYSVRPLDSEGKEVCASGSVVSVVPPHIDGGATVNRPPYFVSDPMIAGDIRAPYLYQAQALDADSDKLSYHLLVAPKGMTIDADSGEINWQPTTNGIYAVNIEVTDPAGAKATQAFSIEVIDGNLPPKINNTLPARIPEKVAFSHKVDAVDPENQRLAYSIQSQASGMTINNTGTIYWGTPLPGRYPITVVVTDPHGAKAKQSVVLVVMSKPVFISQPVIGGTVNQPYYYQAQAKDVDGDKLTYQLKQAPNGMTIDSDTGEINWLATSETVETIIVEAVDQDNNHVSQTYTLTITSQANRAPVITSQPKTYIAEQGKYVYQLAATDADGDNLMWSLLAGPSHAEIDPQTGLLQWNATTAGVHPIKVQVSDRRGGVAEQAYSLRVGMAANSPPQILSVPRTTSLVGAAYSYQIEAIDADNDPLTYKLDGAPSGASLTTSGLFSWPNPVLGSHPIKLSISDGLVTVTQSYLLNITQQAIANQPPQITSIPKTVTTVNSIYSYQMSATDPDGDALVYQIKQAPAGATISADGLFSWQAAAEGAYVIRLAVSDGYFDSEQSYTLLVQQTAQKNRAPQIISSPVMVGSTKSPYQYSLVAVDPDGDPLVYLLEEGPAGAVLSSEGLLTWQKPVLGIHNIKLVVSDGDQSIEQSYLLTIGSDVIVNKPPVITSTPKVQGTVDVTYQYQFTAQDPDNDPLTYSLVEGPAGITVDSNGLLEWIKPSLGLHPIKVQVSDGTHRVIQSFGLGINKLPNANRPPLITTAPPTTSQENVPYVYSVRAVDPDQDPIVFSLDKAPAGMVIDSKTGELSWPQPVRGLHTVVVRVSDGQAWVTQHYQLNVDPAGTAGGTFTGQLLIEPQLVDPKQNVTVNITLSGGTTPYQQPTLTLDGQAVAVVNNSATVSSDKFGLHTLIMSAKDANGREVRQQGTFIVKNKADVTAPKAEIIAPAKSDNINVAEITTTTEVIGTAQDENLVEYQLYISPANEEKWHSIGKGTSSVVNGKLATINPQTMANGLYDLLLIVKDQGGNQSSAQIGLIISGEQKIGQFSLSFVDLDIDVGSLPLRLTRTYDTVRQNERLDFGHGWSVNYQDVKIQSNGVPGRDWQLVQSGSGLNSKFCPRPMGTRLVTVRLPDGKMEKFDVKSSPECNTWMDQAAGNFFKIKFEARAGTYSSLEATDVGDIRVHGNQLIDYGTTDKVNPQAFKLTSKEGMVYYLDKSFGIRQIKDRHGNTLSYTRNGIQHSNGAGLIFTRDNKDRIIKVDAPDGRVLNYTYNGDGNLEEVIDAKRLSTYFTYHVKPDYIHQLDEIIGADKKRIFKAEFDENGQLISQADGQGFKVNLDHDTDNNKDTITDRNGNKTTYLYDDRGNITEITDAKGNVTKYTYDSQGNETSITDALGNTTYYDYDQWGNVTKETNALGHFTETSYNQDGSPTEVIDELGRKIVNSYDKNGSLTAITDAMGNKTNIDYTGKGDLAAIADQMGNTIKFAYQNINGKRLPASETDAAGNVTTFEYDKNGYQTARKYHVLINGIDTELVTRKTYDDNGNVLTETDEKGNVTSYQYDALNQLIESKDPGGQVTRYVYNERGEQTEVIYPDGNKDITTFDKNGNEIKSCSAGVCTETLYDHEDRPIQVTDAMGHKTQTVYDPVGNVITTLDGLANKTHFEYDALGRQTKITDALGNSVQFEFDSVGNMTKQINALGHATTTLYNDLNQAVKKILPTGSQIEYRYDATGRSAAIIDAQNNATQFSYNTSGQLLQVVDALNNRATYGYDPLGRLTVQNDANHHTTRFIYNEVGQRIQRELPAGQKERWDYNNLGQVVKYTDFNNKATQYRYNVAQQLAEVMYPDARKVSYGYSQTGYLTKVTDSVAGDLVYQSDLLGRTTELTTPVAKLGFGWDANSNKVLQTVNDQSQIAYGYDAVNRLTTVTAMDGSVTSFEYDQAGNRTKIIRSNGTTSLYSYNPANQLTEITHQKGSNLLAKFSYSLDENGRRIKAEETVNGVQRTVTYHYDATGKLLEEQVQQAGQTSTTRYSYDAVGNRLSKVDNAETTHYSYDANDRLISETNSQGTITYQWDANGNLIKKTSAQGVINYGWSSSNKLSSIDDQITKTKVTYQYDGEDSRIGKVVVKNGQTTETQYLVDNQRPYSEVVLEKTRVNQGCWSETLYLHTPDGVGDLLTQDDKGQVNYLYQDGQGSTRLVADNQGIAQAQYHYDAFGNVIGGSQDSAIKHKYVGEYLDSDSGFYHLRARDYDPKIGRFISRDSFEGVKSNPVTLNPYLYADSDPVNGIDPSGYFSLSGMMSGLNIQSNLQMIARDMLWDYVWDKLLGDDTEDGEPGLIDHLLAMMIKALAYGFVPESEATQPSVQQSRAAYRRAPIEEHHTIPVYLCGPKKSSYLAPIDNKTHDKIHKELYDFTRTVNVAGKVYELAFHKRKGWKKGKKAPSTATQKLGRTSKGRQAIALGLGIYYADNGYIHMPTKAYNGKAASYFGLYFMKERRGFVKTRAKGGTFTYPACSR